MPNPIPEGEERAEMELIEAPEGARNQGRDVMVDAIETAECDRAYDLADRIIHKLNQAGWWFVWGADVEHAISQEHPFNVRQGERLAEAQALVADMVGKLADAGRAIRELEDERDHALSVADALATEAIDADDPA